MMRARWVFAACLLGLGLIPQPPAYGQKNGEPVCKLPKIGGFPVTVTSSNHVTTTGDVDGNPVRFLIDTGSPITVMNPRPDGQRHAGTNKGTFRLLDNIITTWAYRGKVSKLTIGDYIANDVTVAYSDMRLITNVYGVLGGDIFGAIDVEMDLSGGAINLFAPNKCGESAIYWADKFSEADLAIGRRQINIIVELNGTRARAALDTGAQQSWISWELAGRLGLNPDSPGMIEGKPEHPDSQAGKIRHYRFSELKVGDEVVKNANLGIKQPGYILFWGTPSDNFSDVDMMLGVDFLRNHHLYVDHTAGKVYFTWNGKTIFSPPESP